MTRPRPVPSSGPPLLLAALLLAGTMSAPAALRAQQTDPEPPPVQEPPPERTGIDSPYRWIERSLRVGPYVGWWSADRGELDFGPGSTAVVGGRFRARISSPLSLEAGLGLGDSERYVVDPRLEGGPAIVDTVGAGWARAEAGVQLAFTGARTWNGLQPYALFGGGLLFGLDSEESAVLDGDGDGGDGDGGDGDGDGGDGEDPAADLRYEIGTSPFFQGALGVEWIPSTRLGVGLEVRDQLLRVEAPDGFFAEEVLERIDRLDLPAPERVEWTHHLEFSLTLWYYL